MWGVHEGGERFQTITAYNTSLEHRYGAPKDFDDFMRKAYAMDYEGERAMFEAYTRNKYTSTGVIQWMLNNAWPSLIWHLYDYYLTPAGGYYGTKKACEPVHVMFSYDDRAVVVSSENGQSLSGVNVTARLYNLDATEKWSRQLKIDVAPDTAATAFNVPAPPDLSTTYFLTLTATDQDGKPLSSNFYWLSTKADELDWTSTHDTVYTPQSAYADMTGLQELPRVALTARVIDSGHVQDGLVSKTITLKNPGKSIAFMIHLRLLDGHNQDITPTLWDDNYISLLPGESRQLLARFPSEGNDRGPPHITLDGWNVTKLVVPLP
jgi:exo-1,4-beta-D-glucosaminidase